MVSIRNHNSQKYKSPRERSIKGLFTFTWHAILCVGWTLSIAGCMVEIPTESSAPIPTNTRIAPSATFAYPTIPPSATPIPKPSSTPTPDILSGLGEVLFQDDFNSDLGWDLVQQAFGAISLSNQRLVIALHRSQSFLFSLTPEFSLSDFFLEVEVRMDICQSGDEFGIVFRANESNEHYRFSLDCDGESRVVRILSGESRSLISPTPFPFIHSGPMSSNHLCVKAVGDTFQFWINGFEAFSVRDISLARGAVGLFARSGQGNQETISFDNFILREVLPISSSTATAIP
jgi:hypothetical protein